MQTFDARKGKRLPYEIVADMRFFGFYIGNDTLLIQDDIDVDIVYEKSEHLGMLYALELFGNYNANGTSSRGNKKSFISTKEYVKSLYQKSKIPSNKFPFTKNELQESENWRSTIARFFIDFGFRTLDTEPLKNLEEDYAECFLDYAGSPLEALTALVCNIVRFDKNYNVINEEWMRYRASQMIRYYNDDTYKVTPKFKVWETSLWC
ncbi:hypothetical protein [Bernardetia sp.]|uniref:DUF7677 family protein n=1 Tax=Bernardetia sp. TaxID=1937974 RepID=UPI0025BBD440|nr:hypothetical protein [Bernardetia sp.]